MSPLLAGLIILAALQLSSCSIYVRRGSDITDCSMKCPDTDGVLELYRICGGDETRLLELWCDDMWHYNRYRPRLLYNTTTGCWSLTDAGKDDSCVYNVVYIGKPLTTFPITVLGKLKTFIFDSCDHEPTGLSGDGISHYTVAL